MRRIDGMDHKGKNEVRVSTDTLMRRVMKSRQLDLFLNQNEANLDETTLSEYLRRLCDERGLVAARVISEAQIERSYGYQIFRGIRKPSRDKILQIAFGMHLNMEETTKLLRIAGRSPLYPRLKRDAIIAYCLKEQLSVYQTQEYLGEYGLSLLGEVDN